MYAGVKNSLSRVFKHSLIDFERNRTLLYITEDYSNNYEIAENWALTPLKDRMEWSSILVPI